MFIVEIFSMVNYITAFFELFVDKKKRCRRTQEVEILILKRYNVNTIVKM